MKTIVSICLAFCLNGGLVFAESSKMTKIDLDVKTTNIVKADLGRDDLVYYMDTTACLCWISQSMGSSFAVSVFDCSKLAAHPKLEKYALECGGIKKEELKQAEPTTLPEAEDKAKDAAKTTKETKKTKK